MATTANVTYGPNGHARAMQVQWPALANGETGAAVEVAGFCDRSIQFEGTPGAGGSVQFEGSNDGVGWQLLTDMQGNDIVKTAADLEQVSEFTRHVRPRCTAGDGTTSWRITLFARR